MPVENRYEIIRPRVVDETIDDEVIVINLDTGVYYGLRQTAAAIWTGVAAGASVPEIAAAMRSHVAAAPDDVSTVIDAFVSELVQEGLTRTSGATEATPWSVPFAISRFVAPILEKFTDLEDLLLLDPIHDVNAEGWPHIAGA